MYLQKLKNILPLPAKPVEIGSYEAWGGIEIVLGTILPL